MMIGGIVIVGVEVETGTVVAGGVGRGPGSVGSVTVGSVTVGRVTVGPGTEGRGTLGTVAGGMVGRAGRVVAGAVVAGTGVAPGASAILLPGFPPRLEPSSSPPGDVVTAPEPGPGASGPPEPSGTTAPDSPGSDGSTRDSVDLDAAPVRPRTRCPSILWKAPEPTAARVSAATSIGAGGTTTMRCTAATPSATATTMAVSPSADRTVPYNLRMSSPSFTGRKDGTRARTPMGHAHA